MMIIGKEGIVAKERSPERDWEKSVENNSRYRATRTKKTEVCVVQKKENG